MHELVDPLRHLEVFSPEQWGERRIDVIGVDAVHRRVVLSLAKLGIRNLHVWETHQTHENLTIMQHDVKSQTGIELTLHPELTRPSQRLGEVVFLSSTTPTAQDIFTRSVQYKIQTKLAISPYVGRGTAKVWIIDPQKPPQVRWFEGQLNTVARDDGLGAGDQVLAPVVDLISGLCVFQLIRYFAIATNRMEDVLDNEIVFRLQPMALSTRSYGNPEPGQPVAALSLLEPLDLTPWRDCRVDVIGVGATGSRVVWALAKLGLRAIHVWDFDTVESHNVANQIYGLKDIGRLKVDALRDQVKTQTGIDISMHPQRLAGPQHLGPVVFLLTDTMASRREIVEHAVLGRPGTRLLIETRMGTDQGRVYTIDTHVTTQVQMYQDTLHVDVAPEVSACGTGITVGPTAEFLAGLAVLQFIRYVATKTSMCSHALDNELIFGFRPMVLMTRRFVG